MFELFNRPSQHSDETDLALVGCALIPLAGCGIGIVLLVAFLSQFKGCC